jgi:hypothetical protein
MYELSLTMKKLFLMPSEISGALALIILTGLVVGLIAGLLTRLFRFFWPKNLFPHLLFHALFGIVGAGLSTSILAVALGSPTLLGLIVFSLPGAVVMALFWTWISATKARSDESRKDAYYYREQLRNEQLETRQLLNEQRETRKIIHSGGFEAMTARNQARIFISYRREDVAHSGRIADRLGNEFGSDNVFMDVDTIPLGSNFVEEINKEIAKCDVLLVPIGSRWLELLDANQTNAEDYMRVEIAAALKRKIPVIPILADGAKIPPADRLPEELKELAQRHALNLRHESFKADMDRLVQQLKTIKSS